jgi:hypothetical protein
MPLSWRTSPPTKVLCPCSCDITCSLMRSELFDLYMCQLNQIVHPLHSYFSYMCLHAILMSKWCKLNKIPRLFPPLDFADKRNGYGPLKVGNRPHFDVFRRSATWRWKALDESYNFGLDLTPIGGWSREIWAPKVPRVQPGTILGRLLWSPGKNSHLDVASAESCRVNPLWGGRQ